MDKLLDLISSPISILHNEAISGNKNILNDYIAYVTTYANACRLGKLSEDDKRSLRATISNIIKEVPSLAKTMKEILKELEIAGGDPYTYSSQTMTYEPELNIEFEEGPDELNLEFDEQPTDMYDVIIGEGEKEDMCLAEFQKNIIGKLVDICKYIEGHMQKYKVPGIFMYRHEHDGDKESLKISLNESLSYETTSAAIDDIMIMLEIMLEIVDYTDVEAVKIHSTAKLSTNYEGFDERIKSKQSIKEHLDKAIAKYKDTENICKIIEELDLGLKVFADLISPDNKSTCIKRVINFIASIGKDKKIEPLLDKGDTSIMRGMKYITINP